MSFEWTSQPLSIQSIATQYSLPVAIRSAPGFRGSTRPIILYSISRVTFGFGRALRLSSTSSTKTENVSYRPIDSEIVAIPLKYPGYFECLSSHNNDKQTGVVPEKSIQPIVERMEVDHRPQAFYISSPIRVYTIELNSQGVLNRIWHQIEAHQMILFDKLVHVEYTPTVNDDLTDDDYALSWWMCFRKQISPRNEYAIKCILTQQQICYISCSSKDELNLIPVGQRGSNNVNKLQMIHNLIEQFPMPINIKLAQLPGSYAYKDFNGHLQLLGARSEEFAVCASLTTSNIAIIPTNTPLKFVVASLSSLSPQIQQVLSSCHIFTHSFDMQIRRILMSAHHEHASRRTRTRYPKIHAEINNQFKRYKRSYSVDQNATINDDQTTTTTTTTTTPTTDEGYRSNSSTVKRRNQFRQQRSASVNLTDHSESLVEKRRSSTSDDMAYNSLVHPVQRKKRSISSSSSPLPPALPEKPPNFPYPHSANSSNLIEDIDTSNAEGGILMDASNELFLALPSDSRFT